MPFKKALLRKVTAPAVLSDPITLGQPRQGHGRGLILTDKRIIPPNNFDSERFSLAGHRRKSVVRDGERWKQTSSEEFDPGSERTLAAWLRHASRTDTSKG
jgi:hypothetical protein